MSSQQNIVKDLEETLFLFDFDKDGKFSTKEVGEAIRSIGLCPTEAELKSIISDMNGMGGTADAATVAQLIAKRGVATKVTNDELKDAFQVFDKQGTGCVSVSDLKISLTTLAEKLTNEQVDELIREVDQDGEGMVNYEDVIRVLLS